MSAPTLAVRGRLARSVYAEREDKNSSAPDQFAMGLLPRLHQRVQLLHLARRRRRAR